LQWLEIKSLWIRVLAGMLIATAMGVLIRKYDRINGLFIFAFFGMSIAILAVYSIQSLKYGYLISPGDFLGKYLFDRNKVGAAFFSVIDLAVGCALLVHLFCSQDAKSFTLKALPSLFLMILSFGSSIVARSKNGVGIGIILLIIFMIRIIFQIISTKNFKKLFLGIFMIIFSVFLLGSVVIIHKKTVSPGWDSLLPDIQVAIQIDKHQAWKGFEAFPKNNLGKEVVRNNYERVAWFVAGSREILRHPLGYGLINQQSFSLWLKKDGISINGQGSTHSGWVDLGLSFGFPAIIILFTSLLILIFKGAKNCGKSLNKSLLWWISLAVFLSGFVQEITFKHTFEAMIFFTTFSSACFASISKNLSTDHVFFAPSQLKP
jgi:hypothetical protein